MNVSDDQTRLLIQIVQVLNRLKIPYFVTGSQATIVYGEPRFTNDIDLVAEISDESATQLLAEFQSPEFDLSESAVRSAVARSGMFSLLHPSTGVKFDFVVMKDSDFDRTRMQHAGEVEFPEETNMRFARPEDVILMKLQWYQKDTSDRHLRDIAGVLRLQGDDIDSEYLEHWLPKLNVASVWEIVQ